jgi:hypothetical protein
VDKLNNNNNDYYHERIAILGAENAAYRSIENPNGKISLDVKISP